MVGNYCNNSNKKFVSIFNKLESVHLHKDVGQIPYQMHKHFGYDVEIVCRRNETQYKYINKELTGLKLRFVFSSFYYLLLNARKIDVLMLFHIKTETIYLGLLYKILNPNGFLYVKYDHADPHILYSTWGNKNIIAQLKRSFYFYLFKQQLDLLSIECRKTYLKLTKIPDVKKMYLPNGFDPDIPSYYGIHPKPFEKKDNFILLVGRHGSEAKNSELILDALERMGDIGDWQVIFVGPMTKEFEQLKNTFVVKHPHFRNRVIFTGNIEDKKELFDYYNRSKIFCLPSRWESWGLVCGEAIFFGNVLLMSDKVVSAYDLTNDGQSGFVVASGNAAAWAEQLTALLSNPSMLADYSERASQHFTNNLIWKNILNELHIKISEFYSR